jgi:hypothetical protein
MDLTVRAVDIRRERDIEQLCRVAIAQEAQIYALVRTLRAKCDGTGERRERRDAP